ncbi:hypothetical protein SH668x_001255 [Planctomicrobium sp. SH668]|uniref:hypothetical protein n=1 Tax=Planctomicrobium sp. SH668 TaxID=3448126 RepID=UPI003F5B0C82
MSFAIKPKVSTVRGLPEALAGKLGRSIGDVTKLVYLGNSIAAGASASAEAVRYPNLAATALGVELQNVSESGASLTDYSTRVFPGFEHPRKEAGLSDSPDSITHSTLTAIEGNYNGMRNFGPNSDHLLHHHMCHLGIAAWAAIADEYKTIGQSSKITKTGTWSLDSRFGGSIGIKSSQAGSTLTVDVKGSTVYVWMVQESQPSTPWTSGVSGRPGSGGSTFSIAIDGVATTISGVSNYRGWGNRMAWWNDNPVPLEAIDHSVWCYRFANLDNTTHRITVTVDTIGNTPNVAFVAACGNADVVYGERQGPWVLCEEVIDPHYKGAGALQVLDESTPIEDATNVNVYHFAGKYRAAIAMNASNLISDGLQVIHVSHQGVYDKHTTEGRQSSPTDGDFVHPNDLGHQQLADGIVNAILRPWKNKSFPGDKSNSFDESAFLAKPLTFTGGMQLVGTNPVKVTRTETTGKYTPVAGTMVAFENYGGSTGGTFIQTMSGTSGEAILAFGRPGNLTAGLLKYKHAVNELVLRAGGVEGFTLSASQLGLTVPVKLPSYLVATLPVVGVSTGALAHTENARKKDEGSGSGTGCLVWRDGSVWRTTFDNSIVAA